MARLVKQIASDIYSDWKNVSPYAEPYLQAMMQIESAKDQYFADSAKSVILYFLANAQTWRGEKAKAIKTELKAMVK